MAPSNLEERLRELERSKQKLEQSQQKLGETRRALRVFELELLGNFKSMNNPWRSLSKPRRPRRILLPTSPPATKSRPQTLSPRGLKQTGKPALTSLRPTKRQRTNESSSKSKRRPRNKDPKKKSGAKLLPLSTSEKAPVSSNCSRR